MNKGFLQSSNWSSMKNQTVPTSSSSSLAMSLCHDDSYQELPVSWSQLLLGGSLNDFQTKKLVDVGWEDQMVAYDASAAAHRADDVNQEASESRYMYGTSTEEEIQQLAEAASWAPWGQIMNNNNQLPVLSSPRSCVTTSFGSNMLDFSNSKPEKRSLAAQPVLDHSSECNSKETGAASKKMKVVSRSAQSTFRVRKEKLGDRITALHQLVSPFGKTDTASVLLEAIGYIRFLQNQIEALSSPYLGSGESDSARQLAVKGRSCIFPEDPGQVDGSEPKDLRSRGLCLMPLSCTLHVGGNNGADYWAASLAAGFR